MGIPISTGASSNTMKQSSTLPQDDLLDLSIGSPFMNIDYSEISSSKERLDDSNADYDSTHEVSDSDSDQEDVNLQEKYPRDINNTYSPSKIITNTSSGVYFADDSSSFTMRRNSNANLQGYNGRFEKNDECDLLDFDEMDIDDERYDDDEDEDEGVNDSDDNDNPLEVENDEEEEPVEELNGTKY